MVFTSFTVIHNIREYKKLNLFINGSVSSDELNEMRLGISITNGIWENEEEKSFKYILLRMKNQKVILATNELEDIKEYLKK